MGEVMQKTASAECLVMPLALISNTAETHEKRTSSPHLEDLVDDLVGDATILICLLDYSFGRPQPMDAHWRIPPHEGRALDHARQHLVGSVRAIEVALG
jgi:hypothetical protein